MRRDHALWQRDHVLISVLFVQAASNYAWVISLGVWLSSLMPIRSLSVGLVHALRAAKMNVRVHLPKQCVYV